MAAIIATLASGPGSDNLRAFSEALSAARSAQGLASAYGGALRVGYAVQYGWDRPAIGIRSFYNGAVRWTITIAEEE